MCLHNSYVDDMRPNRRSDVVELNYYYNWHLLILRHVADTGLPRQRVELYKIKCKIIWDADTGEVFTVDMNGERI
jgi:hypothetical protein